jgi:hypothetical protein
MIGVRDSALDVAHGCNHGRAVAATGSALRRYFYGSPLAAAPWLLLYAAARASALCSLR